MFIRVPCKRIHILSPPLYTAGPRPRHNDENEDPEYRFPPDGYRPRGRGRGRGRPLQFHAATLNVYFWTVNVDRTRRISDRKLYIYLFCIYVNFQYIHSVSDRELYTHSVYVNFQYTHSVFPYFNIIMLYPKISSTFHFYINHCLCDFLRNWNYF